MRELTDGQLLERFATARGETAELAFAALVERHGPMVLRVCRSVLLDSHDAQDAFQATFLVLVEKARALWVRDSLGPWLHQVSYRTATCARAAAARRRRHERWAASAKQESHVESGSELEQVLHEEIDRLPERYRAPIVLCDLGGRSQDQAARHLGWPVGTVKSRLSRGRERLRDRLRRRGLTPNASVFAVDAAEQLIPPALVHTTTRAAIQFVSTATLVEGSAIILAREVLKAMSWSLWLKVGTVGLVLGLAAPGVHLLAQKETSKAGARPEGFPKAVPADDMPVLAVKPGTLSVTLVERGNVEASNSDDVYSRVEGRTTIISIRAEGSHVKKGDLVCQLDTSALKDNLVNQEIAEKGAEAAYQNAKLAREWAKIAVTEYEDGFKIEQDSLKGTINSAQNAIRKAQERLERTRRARQQVTDALAAKGGEGTPADIVAKLDVEDRLDAIEQVLERETKALELAKAKQVLLEKYTRDRMINTLTLEVERKRSDELAKEQTWQLEKSKVAKLLKQIENCKIYANGQGILIYANDPNSTPFPQIEEGATVRERQRIFSVLDPRSPMRVNAKVRESIIAKITRGLRARIKVDAFAEETLPGVVEVIKPLPDPSRLGAAGSNVYSTWVKIEKGLPGLRPGMTAEVEILITQLENVLSVPVQAVVRHSGKDHLAIKKPDGGIEWRVVTLGATNDKDVEVKQGLESGETVVLAPLSLMSEAEKREKLGPQTKPAAKPGDPQ
jgi:RNA polymerase sigma factor (sigma-70 family)